MIILDEVDRKLQCFIYSSGSLCRNQETQNMQHLFALLVLLHMQVCLLLKDCEWKVVLNDFDNLGGDQAVFFRQHPVTSVASVFQNLTDSAIDLNDKNSHYLGFPYYLKISLTCITQDATKVIRSAHLTGLRPIVTVTFEAPVNTERQKPQELQIEMKGAPYRLQGPCASEEVCRMCWYTPMPMTKRSVVMEVLVKSNGLGLEVDDKRFVMNINGYVKETETGLQSSLGEKFRGESPDSFQQLLLSSRLSSPLFSSWEMSPSCPAERWKNPSPSVLRVASINVTSLAEMISLDSRSRPIWSTFNQAPVLILGGFQDYKIILVSDSEFADFTAVEVGIDSCWIGSVNCPLDSFSSSIFDAIATESVLLLRQNQLVYYFTGNYSVLFLPVPGSGLWTRVLNNICVSRLNPVHFPHNDSEFVIALGGGVQEGEFFLGTIRDGAVRFPESHAKGRKTVCEHLNISCAILWAVYVTEEEMIVLLVEGKKKSSKSNYYIMAYDQGRSVALDRYKCKASCCESASFHRSPWSDAEVHVLRIRSLSGLCWGAQWGQNVLSDPASPCAQQGRASGGINGDFWMLYSIPRFIPKARICDVAGTGRITRIPRWIPRGLSYNPFSTIFYIWGNVILQSYDLVNYIHLSDFPQRSPISYFILSYVGEFVCVTVSEEIWFSVEGSSVVVRLYPSEPWDMFFSLQLMRGSKDFSFNETFVSLFFNKEGLQQLVYIPDGHGEGKLIKRNFPLHYILSYRHLIIHQYHWLYLEDSQYIKFFHPCSFSVMRLEDLPAPQRFTRMEHYCTEPPEVMDRTGFHNNVSLAVYQGLIFQLLWLHADYSRPYADPVHDPTWRWWKNRKQYGEYFFYVASNGNSSGGVYVDMEGYTKIYDLQPNNQLPSKIYLDKNNVFSFSVFLSIRSKAQSMEEMLEENSLDFVWLTVVLAHPRFVVSDLHRHYLMGRGSVLYLVTIRDTGQYPEQELSGTKLLKSSMALKPPVTSWAIVLLQVPAEFTNSTCLTSRFLGVQSLGFLLSLLYCSGHVRQTPPCLQLCQVVNSATNCYHYTASGPKLQGYAMVPIFIGCPPGKRLAFDITRTLKYTTKQNKRYFDCIHKNPELPCFFFNDVFYPFFLIQDMVTGDSGPFMGSYMLRIIGGGPYSESRIRLYSPSEILDYNTANGSTPLSLIWMRANHTKPALTDPEGFNVFSGTDCGIKWICEQNSPCYDVVPLDLTAPDYFFLVEVSNRAVDKSTYCDYDLEFVIHIHGLRLSPSRAIAFMKISMAVLTGIVFLYVLHQVLGPVIGAGFTRLIQRFEEALAVRTESNITFSGSSSIQSQGNSHHTSPL
ncbi:cation channel sperm-associated protein subunit gamma [Gopherus evgoodei]|uniref:cation channel sperm-associated protein subunit gamma n=1 Tax=Gopherus evgoodei TaxID=1825980 RepID=UPI0011CFD158|nr:cation channel sperm-associated protein subunit gamma [Gopherus evgoodei]